MDQTQIVIWARCIRSAAPAMLWERKEEEREKKEERKRKEKEYRGPNGHIYLVSADSLHNLAQMQGRVF